MGDHKRSHLEELDYHIAISRFDAAFEASMRLRDDDREALLRNVAQQMLSQLRSPDITAGNDTAELLIADTPL